MNTAHTSPFEALVELDARVKQNAFELPEKQTRVESWNGVGFTLNDQQFAVQIGEVTEILPVPSTTPLPGVQTWAKGVSNVRGRLLPIIDLGEFLGKVRDSQQAANRIMVVEQGKLSVGLIVDEVQGMVHFSTSQFSDALPDSLFEEVKPFTVGRYQQDKDYMVFNTQLLVNDARFLKAAKE
ncbi:chemotaxis protein CheW [Endozoicomonas arenosclerae]|uniref:chemotaxis protein CheW n=1 Tax=Endozoicomonas arenosclerae TaxID=1633495 RepID=UPI0007860F5B|nr:chemotaxis protein CheW [Endozoicomonas arenosclerae]